MSALGIGSADDMRLPGQALYVDINACQNLDQLHAMAQLLWEKYHATLINADEANYLASCIERRKPVSQRTKTGKLAQLNPRLGLNRFAPRPCRRRLTDDERVARRYRKRQLGGSSALPDTLRRHFTEGERAALCVVAGEVKRQGVSDLSYDEIGDRAGVGRTTVQNALHEARRLGLIKITERPQLGADGKKIAPNLTNLIKIISSEWLTWTRRAPSAARRVQIQKCEPHKEHSSKKEVNSSSSASRETERGLAREEGGHWWPAPNVDRWWLDPPVRTANGGWR